MRRFTQSNLDPGNCLQTAIACILEVPPALLPPQHEIQRESADASRYLEALNAWLHRAFRLRYVEVPPEGFLGARPAFPEFVMVGPMRPLWGGEVLSGTQAETHCVVARDGRMVWDVYPCRPGLASVQRWGLLFAVGASDA